jgi:hypothetical protein
LTNIHDIKFNKQFSADGAERDVPMIEIFAVKTYDCVRQDVFNVIDDIHKLTGIRRDIGDYKIAREEHGLQIIDTAIRILFIRFPSRLKYTAMPGRYTELKQIKGSFKIYECTYSLKESAGKTDLSVKLRIQLPYGPIGYVISLMYSPIVRHRVQRELAKIEELVIKSKTSDVKAINSPER